MNPIEIIELSVLILINTLSIFIIIVILANPSKSNSNKWLVLMSFALIGWVNSSYIGFSLLDTSMAVLAYKVNDISVALFLIGVYQFYIAGFLEIKSRIIQISHFVITITYIMLALFSNATIESVIHKEWGNDPVSGVIYDIFTAYVLLFTCGLISLFVYKYFKYKENKRRKLIYFLIGTVLLVSFNIVFNIVSPFILDTERYQHIGDYSAIFFLLFTTYAILKSKFLNLRIALTAFLIGVIAMLIIIDIFVLSRNLLEQGIKFIILIFFSLISVFLVRSVLNEIRQREELSIVNKKLGKSNQRYFSLAREQEDIIDVMGHEIRTPLTAVVQEVKFQRQTIMAQAEKYTSGKASITEYQQAMGMIFDTFKTIEKASANQVALVTSMLETARIDKGRFELNYTSFDIIDSVSSSVRIMQKTADVDIYDISFALKNAGPTLKTFMIEADEVRITQAIQALVSNAMKYGINADTGKSEIQVTLTVSTRDIGIEIKDNGTGIAKEDIAKLGQKFMRLNSDTQGKLKRPGGTGLGLYVVKGIMDHHGGKMEITSPGLGKGSIFSIEFPAKRKTIE